MGDTTYRVVLALETTGNLTATMGGMVGHLGRASDEAGRFRHAIVTASEIAERSLHRVGGVLEGIADKIMHVTATAAKIGGAAIFGAATYGVVHLNNELEQTTISLGAIFQAQGFTQTFAQGFKLAGDQVAKMKVDVKTLPGDLGQLSNIMKLISTPAAQGGLGADQIRQLAGRTMLVSTILGVNQDMAAREMANLLSGRAGAHNILGLRMGLIGEQGRKFNAETPAQRVQEIEKIFSHYQGAADKFSTSFIAIWTTLKDNIKYGFLSDATSPLFESVKKTMASINGWFDNNQDRVRSWARAFGSHLEATWNSLTHAAERFGPALDNLGRRFFELWDKALHGAHELEPFLNKVAGVLEHVNLTDIANAARHTAELKVAGMGLSAAGSAFGAIGTGLRTYGALAGRGGAAAAAGEGSMVSLGTIAGTAAIAIEALGGAAIIASAAWHNVMDPNSKYHDQAQGNVRFLGQQLNSFVSGSSDWLTDFKEKGYEMWERIGDGFLIAMNGVFYKLDAGFIRPWLHASEGPYNWFAHRDAQTIKELTKSDQKVPGLPDRPDAMDPWEKLMQKDQKRLPGGGGGTNIQKVEIIVKGSDDPSRVARLTLEHLKRLGRNPTRSPFVPDVTR